MRKALIRPMWNEADPAWHYQLVPKVSPAQIRRTAGAMAGTRTAIGAGFLLAPRLTMRIAGYAPNPDRTGTMMARLFGARELLLGLMILERLRFGTPEATMLRFNGVCDALDATILAGARGEAKSRWREMLTASGAAMASASWFALAQSAPE